MSKLYDGPQEDMVDADYIYDEWVKDNFFNPVFDFAREHYFDKYEIDYCIELRNILSGKDSELLKHITIEEADYQFNEKMTYILSTSIISYTIKNKNNGR
jgi:hypothetical protein